MIEIKDIKIIGFKLDDKGIQEMLKSDVIDDVLMEFGDDISRQANVIYNGANFEPLIGKQKDRHVVQISTEVSEIKWKEYASGKIGKWLNSIKKVWI